MEILIILFIGCIWGFICYKMAETRGRDKTAGFVYGLFFGLFAIIGYLIGGDSDEKKRKKIIEDIKEYDKNK